ncbi:Reverse transcriptase [Phytophthora palmivora]|uniref:Reverse transcriptase n=1 Tax=Phytophthora palmivora TaxID=4796 RepID=A0A2P4XVV9_9STRA|nr:Reverse transcriptase [Phytophthora palmivora]
MSDRFTLTEDIVLYYLGTSHRMEDRQQEEPILRLVVPSTMVQEVLQNYHDSLVDGYQGIIRLLLDWSLRGRRPACTLFPDCSSSKSRPQFRGYSPGDVFAERPFQLVSMDFVIPLPKARRGNTALLLFQCAFPCFVMGKAMADTTALCVAKAFEECVYRRFGAPTLIRHDRDPRFMSEVFQAFAEMIQSRSRTTLSYRPQANGQLERSVKTVMQSVRVYAEVPLQQDSNKIAEKLIFTINNSIDATRKETSFYLVHGWDAQSTLRAMTSSFKRGSGRQTDALEIALEMAKEYQATEKSREQSAIPSTGQAEPSDEAPLVSGAADDTPVAKWFCEIARSQESSCTLCPSCRLTEGVLRYSVKLLDLTLCTHRSQKTSHLLHHTLATAPRSLFEPGDPGKLYMERVKPRLTKKNIDLPAGSVQPAVTDEKATVLKENPLWDRYSL